MSAWPQAAQQRGPTTAGRCCRAALIGFVSITSISQAAAPDIESIAPLAIHPGASTEIVLSGTDLSDATQLWTSFPSKWESLGEGRFRITADAPPGFGALRAFGSNGVSNLRLVALDDLPTTAETKTNKTRATAQSINAGSAVDGRCEELSYDWFRFRATKGQRVPLEIVAARIGSRFDSVLRIVNSAGRELARNDDGPGLNGDSLLNFTAPQTAEYFIEVRDVNYGGSSAHFYRLRVGGSPLASAMFGGTKDGMNEREPNDIPAKAAKILLTNNVAGRFDKAGDRDWYEFTAAKGERLEFRAATRSLGSPCDAILQIHSADGKRVARSNPSAADEGIITFTFTNAGTYRLSVVEATDAFGPEMFYRIAVKPAAGFGLTLDTDRVNVAPGKSFEMKVTATRGDFKGAITLGVENLPGAFALTNNVIVEGKTNVTMKVTVPETLTPGTWQTLSIFGTAKRDGKEMRIRASTAPALRKQLPLLLHPPPEFDGVIALGVVQPK